MEDKDNYTPAEVAQIIEETLDALNDGRTYLKFSRETAEARIFATNWTESELQLCEAAELRGLQRAVTDYQEAIPENVRENLSPTYRELSF